MACFLTRLPDAVLLPGALLNLCLGLGRVSEGVSILVGALLCDLNRIIELYANAAVRCGRCEARDRLADRGVPSSRKLY